MSDRNNCRGIKRPLFQVIANAIKFSEIKGYMDVCVLISQKFRA